MIYQIDKVMRDVRVALDLNVNSRQLFKTADVDTLTLDEIIRSKIVDAVRTVEMQAETYLLDSGHNFADAVYWNDLCSGWILLPDDFMRLIVFKMSDWERSVYSAINETDDEYIQMGSRFKGIRGTAQKPVCAVVTRPEGRALEFWSCKSEDATIEKAVYLPVPEIREDGIEICERCYRSSIYMAGALVAQALGANDAGQNLVETSKALMI